MTTPIVEAITLDDRPIAFTVTMPMPPDGVTLEPAHRDHWRRQIIAHITEHIDGMLTAFWLRADIQNAINRESGLPYVRQFSLENHAVNITAMYLSGWEIEGIGLVVGEPQPHVIKSIIARTCGQARIPLDVDALSHGQPYRTGVINDGWKPLDTSTQNASGNPRRRQ